MHPTRRQNRRRGRFGGLARDPFAAGIALAENPNDGKRRAAKLNYSVRTLQRTDEYLAAARDTETRWNGVAVSFPGRDSLGRANPRMARRQYA